jgi:hypothetical protein
MRRGSLLLMALIGIYVVGSDFIKQHTAGEIMVLQEKARLEGRLGG